MKFIPIFASLVAAVPASLPVRATEVYSIYELWIRFDEPDFNKKPLSTFHNRVGLWDPEAPPLTVTTTTSTGSPGPLTVKDTIIPTLLGLNNSQPDSTLAPLYIAPQTTEAGMFLVDKFELIGTEVEREYEVKWTEAKRWLAGPVGGTGDGSGEDGGWEVVADYGKEGQVIIEIYMPITIIAKLVAQS